MKILYVATKGTKRNRLDGETVKNRLLEDYLKKHKKLEVISVDTDNWKKNIFKISILIMYYYFMCDTIIVSSADRGAYIILNFLRMIKTKKNIFYFVIGGSLYNNIKSKKWNIETYKRLEKIYVESNILKEKLVEIGIKKNTEVIRNFRKVCKFKNRYKETKEKKFVFYGRVIKEKGIEEAIKLVKRLNSENILSTLDIYGQIKEDYLEKIKKEFDNNIKYCGSINPDNKNEYEILSYYDIFILPTEYKGECLPGALIDAYISGLAVVVSNWTYSSEYVQDQVNGVIFKYKDYNDMYDKTKEMILSDKIGKYKMESYNLAKKYYIDEALKEFSKIII